MYRSVLSTGVCENLYRPSTAEIYELTWFMFASKFRCRAGHGESIEGNGILDLQHIQVATDAFELGRPPRCQRKDFSVRIGTIVATGLVIVTTTSRYRKLVRARTRGRELVGGIAGDRILTIRCSDGRNTGT
jgi:hypothetical protein